MISPVQREPRQWITELVGVRRVQVEEVLPIGQVLRLGRGSHGGDDLSALCGVLSIRDRAGRAQSGPSATSGRAAAGAMLGLLVGLVYAGPHLISFAVQPLTFKILFGWIAGAVIQFAIAGAIVGAIYKPATEHIMYVKERPR